MAMSLKNALLEIKSLKAKVKELEKFARDDLTGLPQRKVFRDSVEQAIFRSNRKAEIFSILSLDLNCLKPVNDKYGHSEGDKMIVAFVELLKKSLRKCDLIARVGGDEFMVFLPDQDEKQAHVIKKLLLKKFEENKKSLPYFEGAAIGSATYTNTSHDFKYLCDKADKAMYRHKRSMGKYR